MTIEETTSPSVFDQMLTAGWQAGDELHDFDPVQMPDGLNNCFAIIYSEIGMIQYNYQLAEGEIIIDYMLDTVIPPSDVRQAHRDMCEAISPANRIYSNMYHSFDVNMADVIEGARAGKIQAIKNLRVISHIGLKDAKDFIEAVLTLSSSEGIRQNLENTANAMRYWETRARSYEQDNTRLSNRCDEYFDRIRELESNAAELSSDLSVARASVLDLEHNLRDTLTRLSKPQLLALLLEAKGL